MNKALINKYWKEFCHWKDGGELLGCYLDEDDMEWFRPYYQFEDDNVTYIINDEHVEYRKALAEGKTVEMHGEVSFRWVKMCSDNFELEPSRYRIKPDEPEFKVGDYVVLENKIIDIIVDIEDATIYTKNSTDRFHIEEAKLWTIEEASDDEWVKYWHKNDTNYHGCSVAYFNEFVKTNIDDNYIVVPDIGQTPEQLGLEK